MEEGEGKKGGGGRAERRAGEGERQTASSPVDTVGYS